MFFASVNSHSINKFFIRPFDSQLLIYFMDKKDLGLYLIAASIIIASIIISQTIKSSRSSGCFDRAFEAVSKQYPKESKLEKVVLAKQICN